MVAVAISVKMRNSQMLRANPFVSQPVGSDAPSRRSIPAALGVAESGCIPHRF